MNLPSARSCVNVACQADEAGIDVDILLHVEDMVRAQRSLVLPRASSLAVVSPNAAASAHALLTETAGRNRAPTLLECLEENEKLREALSLQTKVSSYLLA